ncbi:Glycosyl hydrolase catalytic core [Geosmithia morbida]|uniref:Glycosyl hydrolase catalytic core n=1 Tax=Geosmithia morbida TaxID=1094350 RepID=A0A9P4YPB7_9HYPO|nr:Glycosyl hydrolase catalytic core [Geosmithia morbida]KAF4119263.1 Glycosyl hydrolase catalytic core [Geosmithia morbida]
MFFTSLLLGILPLLTAANTTTGFHTSSKRGLIYIPNSDFPADDEVWIQKGSDLSWYYNYKMYPNADYVDGTGLNFVPMLWGAPSSFSDTTFLENVTSQLVEGRNITHAMGFNEPDNTGETGGSDIEPSDAARYWKKQMEPLRKLGVSLGAPAVTGGSAGFHWLSNFTKACDGGCTFDFIPIHWYGSFDGLASHIADVLAIYPRKKIWVTEFALDNSNLEHTEDFFRTAATYLDKNENVSHYSYFGSFRSSASNVGINVAMLDSHGKLTDIGGWYLKGNSTGVKPDNVTVTKTHATTAAGHTPTYAVPPLATKTSWAVSASVPNLLALLLGLSFSTLYI